MVENKKLKYSFVVGMILKNCKSNTKEDVFILIVAFLFASGVSVAWAQNMQRQE